VIHGNLNPSGPNYQAWRAIFGSDSVPLKSDRPVQIDFGGEGKVECYALDIAALPLWKRARLYVRASEYRLPRYQGGSLIRTEDVMLVEEKVA